MCLVLQAREIGSGPRLLLFHGAAAPEVGWERQEALSERFSLLIPWRRGYGDSPPAEQQDFEAGRRGSARTTRHRAGPCGCVLVWGSRAAGCRRPVAGLFLSLTLIEPPLFGLAGEDPAVQQLLGGLGQLMEKGPEGAPPEVEGMLVLQKLSAERGFPPPPPMRPPFEAQIDFDEVRSAEAPVLVVSGDHHPGWERTCDALASLLDADRAVFAGSGHAPQRANGFNERFEQFLAETAAPIAEP